MQNHEFHVTVFVIAAELTDSSFPTSHPQILFMLKPALTQVTLPESTN